MTKHQTCAECLCGFVGPDGNIGENYCDTCSQKRGGEFASRCVELEAEIGRLQEIVDELPKCWRLNDAGELVQDAPIVPYMSLWTALWSHPRRVGFVRLMPVAKIPGEDVTTELSETKTSLLCNSKEAAAAVIARRKVAREKA